MRGSLYTHTATGASTILFVFVEPIPGDHTLSDEDSSVPGGTLLPQHGIRGSH